MKRIISFFILITTFCGVESIAKAQDVIISIPEDNIFNRTEFISAPITLMYNTTRTGWDYIFIFFPVSPTFRSTSGASFIHNTSSFSLPTSVLQWRLHSMGGQLPNGGSIPEFKSFNTSDEPWYNSSFLGSFRTGNINFTFKIPPDQISSNTFRAGNYAMTMSQNYDFTPRTFRTILTVPSSLRWLNSSLTQYIEIISLNDYRISGTKLLGNLENTIIGNTVQFNLLVKAAETKVKFISSKGATSERNITSINLGSVGSSLSTKPLSATFQNFTTTIFNVEVGNRTAFTPQLSLSAEDFKKFFFEAGTYTFQLNFNARSGDNSVNAFQNTDVQVKVLPLSEITIPSLGQNVNFVFNTAAQYRDGQSQVMPKQIKLSNNESFELYVKSDNDYFKKNGVQTTIKSNILQIGVNGTSASAALSRTPQKIVSNGTPVLDQDLDMKYTISPEGAQSLIGQEKSSYSINVIYSFTAL